MRYETELRSVLEWLDETDAIALSHFGTGGLAVDTKPDGTPVTVADKAVEALLRERIAAAFPGDGVLGEEAGETPGARRWIVDPIDGTKNYARGIPVFGTLIALEDEGSLVLGVVSAPALRNRWWAVRGGGAFRDGRSIRVSSVASLAECDVTTGGIGYADSTAGLLGVVSRARRMRAFGDFWGHVLVAQGSMDVMIEFAPLAEWDVAAFKIIVEEAGGRVSDVRGDAAVREGPLITTNGAVHDEVLRALEG